MIYQGELAWISNYPLPLLGTKEMNDSPKYPPATGEVDSRQRERLSGRIWLHIIIPNSKSNKFPVALTSLSRSHYHQLSIHRFTFQLLIDNVCIICISVFMNNQTEDNLMSLSLPCTARTWRSQRDTPEISNLWIWTATSHKPQHCIFCILSFIPMLCIMYVLHILYVLVIHIAHTYM
jgi:hypothetical protein